MRDYEERINDPRMEYYRTVYKDSKRWDGDELNGKKVIVYMEQGFGDQILFLRFLRFLKAKGAMPILHAPWQLHRLIKHMGYEYFDKTCTDLPNHDLHILSLSLPFVLKCSIPLEPYIKLEEKFDLKTENNIGIAWEGSKDHEYNHVRNCPLEQFKKLKGSLYMMQPAIFDWALIENCEEMDLNGVELYDFYDVAKLINSVDSIVSVDTASLHLAGAMGKKGYGLLSPVVTDPRWEYVWYPTIKMLKGSWDESFEKIIS